MNPRGVWAELSFPWEWVWQGMQSLGAVFSPGPHAQGGSSGDPPPLQGQLGVHWELSQQFLPVGISLHKEEDLVLTQPHFLCPVLHLLSPAASAEPFHIPSLQG